MTYTVAFKLNTYPNLFTSMKEFTDFNMQFSEFAHVASLVINLTRLPTNPDGPIVLTTNTIDSNGAILTTRIWANEEWYVRWKQSVEVEALLAKWNSLGWQFEIVSMGPT